MRKLSTGILILSWLAAVEARAERSPNEDAQVMGATEETRREQNGTNSCFYKRGVLIDCPLGQQKKGAPEPRDQFSKRDEIRVLDSFAAIASQAGIALAGGELKTVAGAGVAAVEAQPVLISIEAADEKAPPKTKT